MVTNTNIDTSENVEDWAKMKVNIDTHTIIPNLRVIGEIHLCNELMLSQRTCERLNSDGAQMTVTQLERL
jgi:hypothetical protein